MYERSAIVLEKYIDKAFGYREINNIRNNYDNYCELVQCLDKYQNAYSKEQSAIQEFEDISNEIKNIQTTAEKLYKKGAKLEYNRNMLFGNIAQNIQETEKCIINVEEDIDNNSENLKKLREKFISAIKEYKDKKVLLSNCKRDRKSAEEEYNTILNKLKDEFNGINIEFVKYIKEFITSENEEEKETLISVLNKNGKGEKHPFDENVIKNATILGIDIAKKEAICYMQIYDKTQKLLKDIENESVKIEKYQEYAQNAKAKLDFLYAEKEYLVQFLDNERLTVIHGKKTHAKLMEEACENLKVDVNQINNLYELILRETTGKPTKRAYKELYNKSYLIDIEEKEAIFKKEKFKVNTSAGTLINLNYWRIEGIKNIYTVFYNTVSEVFGKDLVEFDVPKQINDIEDNEETENNIDKVIENSIENISNIRDIENGQPNEEKTETDVDIFGEKYKNFETSIEEKENNQNDDDDNNDDNDDNNGGMLDEDIELNYIQSDIDFEEDEKVVDKNDFFEDITDFSQNEENVNKFEVTNENDVLIEEDFLYEPDEEPYEEESLFSNTKKIMKDDTIDDYEEIKKKTSKKNIFNKLMKLNTISKKKTVKD